MIEKAWLAIIASVAACLLVTLIPGLAPEVSAHTAGKAGVQVAAAQSPSRCTESWPYYEPACLHDSRRPGGRARVVRIISTERSAVEGSRSPAL